MASKPATKPASKPAPKTTAETKAAITKDLSARSERGVTTKPTPMGTGDRTVSARRTGSGAEVSTSEKRYESEASQRPGGSGFEGDTTRNTDTISAGKGGVSHETEKDYTGRWGTYHGPNPRPGSDPKGEGRYQGDRVEQEGSDKPSEKSRHQIVESPQKTVQDTRQAVTKALGSYGSQGGATPGSTPSSPTPGSTTPSGSAPSTPLPGAGQTLRHGEQMTEGGEMVHANETVLSEADRGQLSPGARQEVMSKAGPDGERPDRDHMRNVLEQLVGANAAQAKLHGAMLDLYRHLPRAGRVVPQQ